GRLAILKVHCKGKPVDKDVDLDILARRTPGFTGADLSNLVNEAALLSARRDKKTIGMQEMEEAIERVMAGPERKSHVMSDEEKKLTAYHEGGHTLVGMLLKHADPVHKVTIIPRGRAGGYTLMLPKEDRSYATRTELMDRLKVAMGGRVAEEIVLKEISTGASADIQSASRIARSMVMQYGMSELLGPISYGESPNHQVFLGRDFNHQRNYSEEVACDIDKEVRRYMDEAYEACRKIINDNRDKLELIAQALLEYETLNAKQLEELMEKGHLSEPSLPDEEHKDDDDTGKPGVTPLTLQEPAATPETATQPAHDDTPTGKDADDDKDAEEEPEDDGKHTPEPKFNLTHFDDHK
ncbi:MAG: ATP-dependent metallopeptidase FtsH/Yme1/Tma family protein, partial [Selenomonadaceae bacterium]|nr:ATP-dependent metallopeptidase FtsH/Yme1/Tma family protein [Selenomonadaceae bacterium]